MSAKQDRQGVRTAADLERKYKLGQDYDEVVKLAANAQRAATNAQSTANGAATAAADAKSEVASLSELVSQNARNIASVDERVTELETSGGGGTSFVTDETLTLENGVLSVNEDNVSLTADNVTFSDGETFQDKYNSGELKGEKGDKGDKGDPGESGSSGLTMKLLWTSPNPAKDFAAQNVTVDLSEYTHVVVEFAQSIWSTTLFASASIVAKNTSQLMQMPMIDSNRIMQLYRTFKAYDTYVAFGDAAYQFPNSNSYANKTNSYIIPYKIYGVKGVQT